MEVTGPAKGQGMAAKAAGCLRGHRALAGVAFPSTPSTQFWGSWLGAALRTRCWLSTPSAAQPP